MSNIQKEKILTSTPAPSLVAPPAASIASPPKFAASVKESEKTQQLMQQKLRFCGAEEVTVWDAATLQRAISEAKSGAVIKLAGSMFQLSEPLVIDKSLHLIGDRHSKPRIECFSAMFVVSFRGDYAWKVQNIVFHHCGTSWGNVVEVDGGVAEFHKCNFTGGVTKKLKMKVYQRAGHGLRVRNDGFVTVTGCSFSANESCAIECDISGQVQGG